MASFSLRSGEKVIQQRVPTGIAGLDTLLYGGFLEGDAVLVAGAPGIGKTSLGLQFVYNGITQYGESGLFITFEEFPQQIYRDALNFGWDLRRLEEENKLKVLFTSPDLIQQDIQRHEGLVPEMIREIKAKRVVVDSITHFRRMTDDPSQFRELIYGVINALKREGLTSMLIRELAEEESLGVSGEDYVADAVVRLTRSWVQGNPMRFLEVVKSRGSRHVAGHSLFVITEEGLAVVPPYREAFFHLEEAASTGVSQLDDLLGGGIPYGCFYLVELDSNLHERAFESNFLREAVTVDDVYIQVTDHPAEREELLSAAAQWEGTEALETALEGGAVQLLGVSSLEEGDSWQQLVGRFESLCQQLKKQSKARLIINLSRLLLRMEDKDVHALLARLLELNHRYHGVCLGVINSRIVDEESWERIRAAADGIVRVWSEGNYYYVQVRKTVNSVSTPVYAFQEIPEPPFMRILA